MTLHGLLIMLVIGFVAGFLASRLVKGKSLGVVGDIVVGVLGAVVGGWLLPRAGIYMGHGWVPEIITATVGAVVLLFLIRLVGRF